MAANGKAAASKRKAGAAARSEGDPNSTVEVDFAGLKLEAPAKLPASFALRFNRIAAREEAGEYVGGEAFSLAERVLGSDQLDSVIEALDDSETDAPATITDLLVAIIAGYGQSAGESEASEAT